MVVLKIGLVVNYVVLSNLSFVTTNVTNFSFVMTNVKGSACLQISA